MSNHYYPVLHRKALSVSNNYTATSVQKCDINLMCCYFKKSAFITSSFALIQKTLFSKLKNLKKSSSAL